MVSIKWCCKQKSGIKLVEPSENLAESYLKMAENALGTMNREKNFNLAFAIAGCYYAMYYSLYAVMMRIGVKCEIHSCSLEFMKKFLVDYYSVEDSKIISKAFELRGIAQYYADKIVDKKEVEYIMEQAPLFLGKTREVLSRLDVSELRERVGEVVR